MAVNHRLAAVSHPSVAWHSTRVREGLLCHHHGQSGVSWRNLSRYVVAARIKQDGVDLQMLIEHKTSKIDFCVFTCPFWCTLIALARPKILLCALFSSFP